MRHNLLLRQLRICKNKHYKKAKIRISNICSKILGTSDYFHERNLPENFFTISC